MRYFPSYTVNSSLAQLMAMRPDLPLACIREDLARAIREGRGKGSRFGDTDRRRDAIRLGHGYVYEEYRAGLCESRDMCRDDF